MSTEASQPDVHDRVLQPASIQGPPAPLICPECGGSIWRTVEGHVVSYSCHVGHRYSEQGMLDAKTQELEAALWTALRVLKENIALYEAMNDKAKAARRDISARYLESKLSQLQHQRDIIAKALHQLPNGSSNSTREPLNLAAG